MGRKPAYIKTPTAVAYTEANQRINGGQPMTEVKNLDRKRVCDISRDARVVEIKLKDCVTRITANPDGTLNIKQDRTTPAV
jgi:hypothetical protein